MYSKDHYKIDKLLLAVERINDKIAETHEFEDLVSYLFFVTTGTVHMVTLGADVVIWDSENDDRHFYESLNEFEDWYPFLVAKIEKYSDNMSKVTNVL